MELAKPQDLFALSTGDLVTKRNLFDLIQFSKVDGSEHWDGDEWIIGNTPQQGINWIGELPNVHGVIIKTRPGSYEDDGWSGERRLAYQYSFKTRSGKISFAEKANEVLVQQPLYNYPIFLFTENSSNWQFEGSFSVSDIAERFVVLHRGTVAVSPQLSQPMDKMFFHEGGRRYVSHLMVERNRRAVNALKSANTWICDICDTDFVEAYGVQYIEAHHKVPISTYFSRQIVSLSDFVLLCPNCHTAVHAYMKKEGQAYEAIKAMLTARFRSGLNS